MVMFLWLLDLDLIEDDGVQGLYWCVDYPWPMSDRDVSSLSLKKKQVL